MSQGVETTGDHLAESLDLGVNWSSRTISGLGKRRWVRRVIRRPEPSEDETTRESRPREPISGVAYYISTYPVRMGIMLKIYSFKEEP